MSDSEPTTSDSLNSVNCPLLPWPSYRKYFNVIKSSENSKNLTVKCVLCQPATKILSVGISSASNLKKHITKLHPHYFKLLTESIEAQKRPRDESDSSMTGGAKQLRIDAFKDGGRTMPAISQLKMDKLVLDFVINDLQPFSIVDRPGFRKLIEGIRPDRQLITRKTLMGQINQAFEIMKNKLISVLSSQDLVCTTADCWTAFNR